jgi:hypothetical protein
MKQYVIVRDEETNEVELIGRFDDGLDEMFIDGKWVSNGLLYSLQMDGFLEDITEAEAMKLITQKESQELQAA